MAPELKTLVLSPRYTTDSIALRNAAVELGWGVERLQTWRATPQLSGQDVVPYGEPLFAAVIAEALQLALIEPRLSWVAEIPTDLKCRDIKFSNFAAAKAVDHASFMKPADDKCFQARVYTSGAELPEIDAIGAMSPVLIAEPVVWECEYRCFVLEKRVATLSIYARNGDIAETPDGEWPVLPGEIRDAIEFAQRVLQDERVSFTPAGVLDVGVIRDRGWAVVEANACWGAGIYGCDPRLVLETLARACVKRAALAEADREWVRARTNVNA